MESAKSTKSTKDKILNSLGYAKWIPRVIMIPTLFYKKINILYETVFKDATTITSFTSFIFQLGIELFWKLKHKYGITTFAEFLRVREFLFINLNELMRMYYNEEMITTVEEVNKSKTLLTLHKRKDNDEFIDFVRKHKKKVLNGRISLKAKDIQILSRVYKRIKLRNEPNKTVRRSKKSTKN